MEDKLVEIAAFWNSHHEEEIPEDATHFATEIDYSNCFYESDTPSVIVTFYKKEKA